MKRSTLLASLGVAVLLAGASTVLAAGRPGSRAATGADAQSTPAWCPASTSAVIVASDTKGRDGAACSSGSECKSGTCEGGSCCTDHGETCDSASHCCGHQSCGSDSKCP